jgi:hypothetical protein
VPATILAHVSPPKPGPLKPVRCRVHLLCFVAMSMCSTLFVALLAAPAFGALVVKDSTKTCPSTSIYYTDSVDAAGTTIWSGPIEAFAPGTCYDVRMGGITAYKICGPGDFKVSRMTCDKHDYKSETISQPSTEFTVSTCKEYSAAGTNVAGHLGSFSYTCSATSR